MHLATALKGKGGRSGEATLLERQAGTEGGGRNRPRVRRAGDGREGGREAGGGDHCLDRVWPAWSGW